MSSHPQIIEKEGRKEFDILPYEEFLQMLEEIENYDDLRILREEKATAHVEPTRSLDAVLKEIKELNLSSVSLPPITPSTHAQSLFPRLDPIPAPDAPKCSDARTDLCHSR